MKALYSLAKQPKWLYPSTTRKTVRETTWAFEVFSNVPAKNRRLTCSIKYGMRGYELHGCAQINESSSKIALCCSKL